MSMSKFKVGDYAYYRDHSGRVERGTVIQIEGGKDGDLTEVHWHRIDHPIWFRTAQLWADTPPEPDQYCVCGCTFGEHSESGCIPHQIHEFQLAAG